MLLGQLFEKNFDEHHLHATMEEVVKIFCQRLSANNQPEGDIHQWIKMSENEKLVKTILNSPECVYELSKSNTWLSWYSNIINELSLKIDRFLNEVSLLEEEAEAIALSWLSYFRTCPEKLKLIFQNLEQTHVNRHEAGQANYQAIKKQCWTILKDEPFSDDQFEKLLSEIYQPEQFDPVLKKLADDEYKKSNLSQSARWLALTINPLPEDIDDSFLVNILCHSKTEDCQSNWQKVKDFMHAQPHGRLINFFSQLIDNLQKENTPSWLICQGADLLISHPFFDDLWPELESADWLWLISNTSEEKLAEQLPHFGKA